MLKSLSSLGPKSVMGLQLGVLAVALQLYFRAGAGAAMLLGAAASAVLMSAAYYVRSFMEAIPTSKVRSVAMGMAELTGRALKWKKEFKAPYSKEKCLAYEIKEERHQRTGKSSYWVTTRHERKDGHFLLDDGTGAILCHTKGASLEVKTFTRHFGNRRRTEWKVVPGTKYFIIGKVVDNPFVEEASSLEGFRDAMVADGDVFIISDGKESGLRKWYSAALVFSALSTAGLFAAFFLV
jgi:hypothetical protein